MCTMNVCLLSCVQKNNPWHLLQVQRVRSYMYIINHKTTAIVCFSLGWVIFCTQTTVYFLKRTFPTIEEKSSKNLHEIACKQMQINNFRNLCRFFHIYLIYFWPHWQCKKKSMFPMINSLFTALDPYVTIITHLMYCGPYVIQPTSNMAQTWYSLKVLQPIPTKTCYDLRMSYV